MIRKTYAFIVVCEFFDTARIVQMQVLNQRFYHHDVLKLVRSVKMGGTTNLFRVRTNESYIWVLDREMPMIWKQLSILEKGMNKQEQTDYLGQQEDKGEIS